jgi:hypothetical protein
MSAWHNLRRSMGAVVFLTACAGEDSREAPRGNADAGIDSGKQDSAFPDASAVARGGFRKVTLHRDFYCEGASFGDFNRDGATDVVAGQTWYEGPDFSVSHGVWLVEQPFDPKGYSNCFFEWVEDFNADGWPDVLVVGFPGTDAAWYENPAGAASAWARRQVVDYVDAESPEFVDITGDGKRELVFATGGRLGWAEPAGDAALSWTFHPLSDARGYSTFMHGLGTGDVTGDGRADVLEATGVWAQPASLISDPLWLRTDAYFGMGGAQMVAYDVDGDADNDVVTTLAAHGYGLAWYEQTAADAGAFVERVIVSADEPAPDAAVILHEPHALAAADIDGDGLTDIVTGERFWGHVPAGTPDFNAPARLYWFRLERSAQGVRYLPTLIDDDSGVGTQVSVGDVTNDGLPDIVVANKKGAFVFVHDPTP